MIVLLVFHALAPLDCSKEPAQRPFCSQQNTTKTGKQAPTRKRQEIDKERRRGAYRNVLHVIIYSQHWQLAFTGIPTHCWQIKTNQPSLALRT